MTLACLVQFGILGFGLAIPLYAYYLLAVKAPQASRFDREQTLASFNRHWHFHVVNENVAIRFSEADN